MTDVERLIADAAEPGPSAQLDARIHELFASDVPAAIRPPRGRREWATLLATAACVGMVGFFLGRASVPGRATIPPSAAVVAEVPPPGKPVVAESTRSPQPEPSVRMALTKEQLATFFARPSGREGPFGDIATIVTRSSSHPE
jgi:hypothetical protein